MTMKTKDGIMIGAGGLAIMLGAMPLNGCIVYIIDPSSFYQDGAVGVLSLSLAGLVPFGAGVLLLGFSRASVKELLRIALCGLLGGLVLAWPALIAGSPDEALFTWWSITAVGFALAILTRWAKMRWRNAIAPSTGGSP
jgi:hypothetical protein